MTKFNKGAFLYELFELYHEYDVTISHENLHGGFELKFRDTKENNQANMDWMTDAAIVEVTPDEPSDFQIALMRYEDEK